MEGKYFLRKLLRTVRSLKSVSLTFIAIGLSLFLSGCTINLDIEKFASQVPSLPAPAPVTSLVFDSAHLDLSELSKLVYTTDTDSSVFFQLTLNTQEYVLKNRISFVNLPVGALITCEDTVGNLALQSVDLVTDKKIVLKRNYWMPLDQDWIDHATQNFSCYYEVGNQRSNSIQFNVNLLESKTVRVSNANPQLPLPTQGGGTNAAISTNGRFVAYTAWSDLLENDNNG